MELQAPPGYDVEGPLDSGGRTWRARQQATGRVVLLRQVPLPPEPTTRDGVRRAAARVAGLSSRHLLPLHTVITTAEGLVLVHDYPAGGTLRQLLGTRQRLPAGEVVTIGVALADAVAEVHAAGLSHGALDEDSVHLGLDGTPLLAGVGLSAGADRSGAADDARALIALCERALGGGPRDADGPAGTPLRAALAAAGQRVDADLGGLSAALRKAAPAVPIRLGAAEHHSREAAEGSVEQPVPERGQPPPEHAPPSGRMSLRGRVRAGPSPRRRHVLVVAGSAIAILLAAVALGVAWGHRSGGPAAAALPTRSLAADPATGRAAPSRAAPSAPGATVSPSVAAAGVRPGPSWRAVLGGLDRARAAAFRAADPAGVARADAPGSAALRRDRAAVAELRRRGARPRGLRWDVLDVTVERAGPPGVTLRVTDRMPAYDLVDVEGRVLVSRPARRETVWRVTLLPAPSGWRLATVAAA